MGINIGINGIRVKQGSKRSLEFDFETKSWHGGPAYFVGLEGKLLYNNFVLSDRISFDSYQIQNDSFFYLNNDNNSNFRGNLVTEISNEAIGYIENIRKDGDIQFAIELIYRWQNIIRLEKVINENIGNGHVLVGPVYWHKTEPKLNVPRSEWIKILKQLKYSEIELFEVNKLSFSEDEKLKQAFGYVREAETQLRSGNYDGVLADCRSAIESLAKYASEGQVKQGFELIMEKVFPEIQKKQDPFKSLLKNISDFSQLGRHAEYPHLTISRDEAEFILISTLNVFSFLSRRLVKTK